MFCLWCAYNLGQVSVHPSAHSLQSAKSSTYQQTNRSANSGDTGSIPGSEKSPGGKNGNPLVFLSGESHGQRRLATVHGVTKNWTWLKQLRKQDQQMQVQEINVWTLKFTWKWSSGTSLVVQWLKTLCSQCREPSFDSWKKSYDRPEY